MQALTNSPGWTREGLLERAVSDIPGGWYVNLGIGLPTRLADLMPADREVIFHSENGLLGIGRTPREDERDVWLINAGKQPVTMLAGGAYFNQADSFGMIRGGHLDLCVLGAFQVAASGDLANWSTGVDGHPPAVGGAMDLAVGAKRVWVLTDHVTRAGEAKLLAKCTYPLTGVGCVQRVYTNFAVLECVGDAFRVIDMASGVSRELLVSNTAAPIIFD